MFAPSALAAGGLKLLFSAILGLHYGLLGIALGTLFAQLLTNHWYMVYRGLKRLGLSFRRHAIDVVAPVVLVFLATAGAVALLRQSMQGAPGWLVVAAGAGLSGTGLAVMLWTQILDSAQRNRVLAMLRLHV